MGEKLSMQGHLTAPNLADIERLARQMLPGLPTKLRGYQTALSIRVEDFPDHDTEDELDLETPYELLGLYRSQKKWAGPGPSKQAADTIVLYRRAILDHWCETGEELSMVIRYVLIHEIGHHVGFSEAEMDRLVVDHE